MTRKIETGDSVSLHYRGTFDNGDEFDSSYERDEPISVSVGSGQLIQGFDSALQGMETGETKTFTIEPAEAYGDRNPEAFVTLPKNMFGENFPFEVGLNLPLENNQTGQPVNALVTEVQDEEVVCDLNHPLAGKTLTFEVEVLGFEDETAAGQVNVFYRSGFSKQGDALRTMVPK